MTSPIRFLIFFISTFTLYGCIDLPKEGESLAIESFKARISNQSWQSDSITLNSPVTWTFHKTGAFIQTISIPLDSDAQSEFDGTYSILGPITAISGHNVFKLNLQFSDTSEIETAPDPLTLIKLDIAYIQDGTLYFGNPRAIENCEDEQETYSTSHLPTNNYFDGVSSASTPISALDCYGRPESINFDNPYGAL